MTTYNIRASRGTRATFCVPATEAGFVGHYVGGKPLAPCKNALRAALPPQWRKALDRAGNFWFDHNDNNKPAFLTLHFPRAESVTLAAEIAQ